MRSDALHFIIVFILTPGDFTRQRKSFTSEWVDISKKLKVGYHVYSIIHRSSFIENNVPIHCMEMRQYTWLMA